MYHAVMRYREKSIPSSNFTVCWLWWNVFLSHNLSGKSSIKHLWMGHFPLPMLSNQGDIIGILYIYIYTYTLMLPRAVWLLGTLQHVCWTKTAMNTSKKPKFDVYCISSMTCKHKHIQNSSLLETIYFLVLSLR